MAYSKPWGWEKMKKLGKKQVPLKKKFNGKIFTRHYTALLESFAKAEAEDLRKKGYNTRVRRFQHRFVVYKRKK